MEEFERELKILENGIKAYCEMIDLDYSDTYGCNIDRINLALVEQRKEAELQGIIMTIDYMFENNVDHVSIEEVIKSVELSLSEVERHSEDMFDCLERWREHSYWKSIKTALENNEK
jgi:hypothetical protein